MTDEQARRIAVFFYGLFMDEAFLRQKGLEPMDRHLASVADFALIIGARATLVPRANAAAHGVLFWLTHREVDALYGEASLAAYRPEAVAARLAGGSTVPALCFNLPASPAGSECNPEYAAKLGALAKRIGLPPDYVASIGRL